jgi:hypothetical protein
MRGSQSVRPAAKASACCRPTSRPRWKQTFECSLNLETSTQALGEEAINLLFQKHRLNPDRLKGALPKVHAGERIVGAAAAI